MSASNGYLNTPPLSLYVLLRFSLYDDVVDVVYDDLEDALEDDLDDDLATPKCCLIYAVNRIYGIQYHQRFTCPRHWLKVVNSKVQLRGCVVESMCQMCSYRRPYGVCK